MRQIDSGTLYKSMYNITEDSMFSLTQDVLKSLKLDHLRATSLNISFEQDAYVTATVTFLLDEDMGTTLQDAFKRHPIDLIEVETETKTFKLT